MMKVIFLDFDGVMGSARHDAALRRQGLPRSDKYGAIFDPLCVGWLAHVVRETQTKIVVSSDWKYIMSFVELLDMWEARSMPGELIGTTPNGGLRRGDEIDQWLDGCEEEVEYVILDDMDVSCFNERQIPRLLVVDPYTGLDEETADRASAMLE